MEKLENRQTLACSDIEHFELFVALVLKHSRKCHNVSFCKVNHIDKVANARAVGGVVIVTEDAQFLAHANSCLGEIRNKVLWNTVWQFANFCRWMRTDWVEVAQQNSLDWRAALHHVGNDVFTYLLGSAIR